MRITVNSITIAGICFFSFVATAAHAQTTATSPAKPAVRRPAAPPAPRTARPPTATPAAPAPAVKMAEGMTNEDVLKMVSAKLNEEIILNAIETAPTKTFDLSPTGLISLKTSGVSDRIILVMQGRPRAPEPAPAPPVVAAPAAPPVVETPKIVVPERVENTEERKGGIGGFFGRLNPVRGGNDKKEEATASTKPKKLKDGETAVIETSLSPDQANAKLKAYFNSKDIDFTVNTETGRLTSDWFGERRCGPGFYRCANRAMVRATAEEGRTVLRVQVIERKREGGVNEKPWKEGSTSKGEQTAKLVAELEPLLALP